MACAALLNGSVARAATSPPFHKGFLYRMSSSVMSGWQNTRGTRGFRQIYTRLRTGTTPPTLVGLVSGVLSLLILLALPEPWNFRIALYLVVLIWTIIRPVAALCLLPIAVPWGSLDYINIGGLNLNSADLLVIFLAIGWLLSFTLPSIKFRNTTIAHATASNDRGTSSIPTYLAIAIVALLGVMFLSTTVAISVSSCLKEISKWLEVLILLLFGAQYICTRRQIWIIIVLTCLMGITQAFLGYYQEFFNLGPTNFVRDASLRVYGTFDQPNPFGGYINIPLSITLALTLLGRDWKTRVLAGIATILLALAEYLSQSKGGYFAIVVASLFIVIVGMPRFRPVMGLFGIGTLGLLATTLAGWLPAKYYNPILEKMGIINISFTAPSPQDYANAERLAHWIAGLRMFFDHPILGVGIGNYPNAYPQYFITIFVNSLGHAHNYYINIAAETGFIGLIVYLCFLAAIFIAGGTAYRHIHRKYVQQQQALSRELEPPLGTRDKLVSLFGSLPPEGGAVHRLTLLKNDRALAIGILAALISVCAHNIVDDLYVHSMTNLIALLIIVLIRLEGVTPEVGKHGG
jgi:O-antigen ligase